MAFLGFYGPQSIPSIQKNMKAEVQALKRKNPASNSDIQLEYTEIERKIGPLTNLGLVKELHYCFHKKSTKVIGFTFKGLICYFRGLGTPTCTKEKITQFFDCYKKPYLGKSKRIKNRFLLESYKELIPFCHLWHNMVLQIGSECLDRLEFTVNNFYVGDKTSFKIEPLELRIETYLNYSGELFNGVFFPRKARQLVISYLQSEEGVLLREAYIAYLIAEDFQKLCNLNETEIRTKLPKLKSVTEFAILEKNENASTFLFSSKGLSRFFPKCESIEYYFTGMFVFNLLWEKKPLNDYSDYYYDEVCDLFPV